MPSKYTPFPQSIFSSTGQFTPLQGRGYSELLNNAGGYSPDTFAGLNTMQSVMGGMPNLSNPAIAAPESMWNMKSFLGTQNSPGWGGMALGAAQGLGNLFMGMKQYDLAKKTLNENTRQFDLNWKTQKDMVNSQLEDRQRARVASNPSAYQSVSAYMDQNRIKG